MDFKKTYKNGDTLTVTIIGIKSLVALNGVDKGTRFSRVGKNEKGIAWAFDFKYGLKQTEMDEINAVLAEATRLSIIASQKRELTVGEKAEKEYCEHYDKVQKAMSY